MASLEQLEIHSRSFLIRYVSVPSEHTIYWSIQPHKKSLNFGIFKHTKATCNPGVHQTETALNGPEDPTGSPPPSLRPGTSRGRSKDVPLLEKLHSAGMQDAYWHGKCEAEKVTKGQFDVPKGQGGVYAMVFDNTFSKQVSKTATFVVLTYPTNALPPASHQIAHHDASPLIMNANSSPKVTALKASSQHNKSMESLGLEVDGASMASTQPGFYNGILKKRKRKRHQGFARRFFSLDFTSSTLSYYLDRDSTALRGAIPLGLAAISASKAHFEIWVDSGAEVWHLRAANQAEWEGWRNALEKAAKKSDHATQEQAGDLTHNLSHHITPDYKAQWAAEARNWQEAETLLGRLSGIRDATRRLSSACQRNEHSGAFPASGLGITTTASGPASGGSTPINEKQHRPFWKRKASGNSTHQQVASPSPSLAAPSPDGRPRSVSSNMAFSASMAMAMPGTPSIASSQYDVTSHVNALLGDLDALVRDFAKLVNDSKHRRWLHERSVQGNTESPLAASRVSMDSMSDQEFFDADDMDDDGAHVMMVENDSEGHTDFHTDDDASSGSDSGDGDAFNKSKEGGSGSGGKAPQRETDLSPLPLDRVKRRTTVQGSTVLPPSLIGFLRKNVGKDLSTIAMPVSANEPLSLLQRVSEQLEYCELLDQAAKVPSETGERLLYIAAFAVSAFSNVRAKERAIRKPFNPMLGETFELVREDKGFRFLAEKVSHRPVIMACQADSAAWTFTQSPMPTQKFWGKSAELNTSGRVRISLHATGDNFSWTCATSFLRNIIAGDKYVEPVGTMTIHHENTGERAVVTFKAKGMFSGRSEDVVAEVFGSDGNAKGRTLAGKWTGGLAMLDENEREVGNIWTVGKLVDNPAVKYGFTEFAASLNEITSIEDGKLPITDARLRPDQRMCEDGLLDEAEEMKLKLEEKQRQRRKVQEEMGKPHVPRWFVKEKEYADEEVWKMKSGKEGYWSKRKKGDWGSDVAEIFAA